MLRMLGFSRRTRESSTTTKANVSSKEIVRQDLLEGAKQTVSFEDGFQSAIFGTDPRKSQLQRTLNSVSVSPEAHGSSHTLEKELNQASRSKGRKKWAALALGLMVATAPVAIGIAAGAGVGAMVGLAATSALTATGVGMDFNKSNAEHKQLKKAERRIPGLAERAAQRLGNEPSSTVAKPPEVKSDLGRFTQEGAIILN